MSVAECVEVHEIFPMIHAVSSTAATPCMGGCGRTAMPVPRPREGTVFPYFSLFFLICFLKFQLLVDS